jgi:hypothetical protein
VNKFIHALRELRAGRPVSSLPTEASLLELLEGSASYTRFQSGLYGSSEETGLTLSVERLQRIKGPLAKTCSLYIKLQERTQTDSTETVRNFSITTEAGSRTRRKANLDCLIRDLTGGSYGPDARSAMFENMSTYLRHNPAVLFAALKDAAEKVASLE